MTDTRSQPDSTEPQAKLDVLIGRLRSLDDGKSRPVTTLEREWCGKAADEIERLRSCLTWVRQVHPSSNADGNACVIMAWEEWDKLRAVALSGGEAVALRGPRCTHPNCSCYALGTNCQGAIGREEAARIIYDAFPFDGDSIEKRKPDWVEGGNSIMQDRARRAADAVLAVSRSTGAPSDKQFNTDLADDAAVTRPNGNTP